MSLMVLGAAVWLPTTAMAQLMPGGSNFSGGLVTLPILFPNGSVTAPAMAFAIDDDGTGTGWYRPAATQAMALSINGTEKYRLANLQMLIGSTTTFAWGNQTDTAVATADTTLRRLAAGVVTQTGGTVTSIGGMLGGGTVVASADPLPVPTGAVFHVSGTTSFTNITTTNLISGACFTMIFDGILTITDGGNLKLTANYTTSADDTLAVCFDGTNFYEVARAVN